ncbi:MAG: hypothetical protein GY729_17045 [Desulfobacteraceae bacterium]|nr:hypothetical protein [Desulfobacteraceae bacterium]
MAKINIQTICVLLLLSLLLIGCNEFGFFVSFKTIDGLRENDAVIHGQRQIGKVTKITYEKDATFLVGIVLSDEDKDVATQNTIFYVDNSTLARGEKALVAEQLQPFGKPVEKGAIVLGQSKSGNQLSNENKGPVWEQLERKFYGFLKEFEKIPESEQYRNMKNKLSELEAHMESSGKEIADKIQNEILPKLSQEIEKFMDKLESQGRQDDVQSLEDDLNKLQSI